MFQTSLKVSPIGLIKMICESLEIENRHWILVASVSGFQVPEQQMPKR